MLPISTTLIFGAHALSREATIASLISSFQKTAVILEGLPAGTSPLTDLYPESLVTITRIAPGCICCMGNLTMRVTLNRILRTYPEQVFISLANSDHLPLVRQFLQQEPYNAWLSLTKEIDANSRN